MLRLLIIAGFFIFLSVDGRAQTDTVRLTGHITTASSGVVPYRAMIINQREGVGTFPDQSGNFVLQLLRTDSIVVAAPGYRSHRISFVDSVGSKFDVDFVLHKLEMELAEHIVMPKRELEDVHEDLKKVELKMPDRPSGVNAFSSPISAIYARFSKLERSKRLVAEMEYRDRKEELLKELFKIYVDADIITLSPDEFDKFIYFCDPSDYFLRTASEIELIKFFKARFQDYLELKRAK